MERLFSKGERPKEEMMETMKELKDIMHEVMGLAKDAGAFIREQRTHFDTSDVVAKGSHDYVSYVDKGAERMIVDRLHQIVPEAEYITEEGTVASDSASNDGSEQVTTAYSSGHHLTWVVDPLDGTTNFIHDMGPYCVAIALRSEEEILVGVVYEIVADELFYTCKGMPSFLNGNEIHVGKAEVVNEAFINIGYTYDVDFWLPRIQKLIGMLYGNCASIRNLGSAEAEICYVACGRFDAYIESHLKPWDVTAGGIILANAGGRASDYEGGRCWMTGEHFLGTNGKIHEELLTKIKDIEQLTKLKDIL